MARPFYVYDNWSAYDELSDSVPLTEELAMRQFSELVRLRRLGVSIDAYLMDAFWYSPDGAYLSWRQDRWPNGPDAWLAACEREGILPGLWFPANTAFMLKCPEAWKDSLAADKYGFCCFKGGFLSGYLDALSCWYARGIRVFKFDFAQLDAVPAGEQSTSTVRARNSEAFRAGLAQFRGQHPEAILLAYNGFEDVEYMPWTDRPERNVFDRRWLEVFDTVYCGDPRPAGVPLPIFWRSLDVYADAQVYLLHRGGLELEEIDNCAFMIGVCGTCYRRGDEDWKTTALLSLARGGRVHMMLGNLEALGDDDAGWLATVQRFYATAGQPKWVGGNPGKDELYAYATDSTITAVNPSLTPKSLTAGREFQIAFSDGSATWDGVTLSLGAGAVAVLSRNSEVLGATESVYGMLQELVVDWIYTNHSSEAVIEAPQGASVHVCFKQFDGAGLLVNTSGGAPPSGRSLAEVLRISVTCDGRPLAVYRPDDKVAWSGSSWAYGIVDRASITGLLKVRFETDEPLAASICAAAYAEIP